MNYVEQGKKYSQDLLKKIYTDKELGEITGYINDTCRKMQKEVINQFPLENYDMMLRMLMTYVKKFGPIDVMKHEQTNIKKKNYQIQLSYGVKKPAYRKDIKTEDIVRLRDSGGSWNNIAVQLGCSAGLCRDRYNKYKKGKPPIQHRSRR